VITLDEMVALGAVLVAAAWLIRYFVRRIRSVTSSSAAPPAKLVQITLPRKDETEN